MHPLAEALPVDRPSNVGLAHRAYNYTGMITGGTPAPAASMSCTWCAVLCCVTGAMLCTCGARRHWRSAVCSGFVTCDTCMAPARWRHGVWGCLRPGPGCQPELYMYLCYHMAGPSANTCTLANAAWPPGMWSSGGDSGHQPCRPAAVCVGDADFRGQLECVLVVRSGRRRFCWSCQQCSRE